MDNELDVQDLSIIKNIIILAASKGLIHPDEFKIVGTTYTKISKAIEHINNQISKPT